MLKNVTNTARGRKRESTRLVMGFAGCILIGYYYFLLNLIPDLIVNNHEVAEPNINDQLQHYGPLRKMSSYQSYDNNSINHKTATTSNTLIVAYVTVVLARIVNLLSTKETSHASTRNPHRPSRSNIYYAKNSMVSRSSTPTTTKQMQQIMITSGI